MSLEGSLEDLLAEGRQREFNAMLRKVWNRDHARDFQRFLESRLRTSTVRAAADLLRTSDGYLSHILAGKSPLTAVILSRVAAATGLPKSDVLRQLSVYRALLEVLAGERAGNEKEGAHERPATVPDDEPYWRFFHQTLGDWFEKWDLKTDEGAAVRQAFRDFVRNLCVFQLAAKKFDLFTASAVAEALRAPADVRRYMVTASDETKRLVLHALAFTIYPFEYAAGGNLLLRDTGLRSLPDVCAATEDDSEQENEQKEQTRGDENRD